MTFQNPALERLVGHWQTTAAGVALAGLGTYAWHQFSPCAPADWSAWLLGAAAIVGPAVLGAVSKR